MNTNQVKNEDEGIATVAGRGGEESLISYGTLDIENQYVQPATTQPVAAIPIIESTPYLPDQQQQQQQQPHVDRYLYITQGPPVINDEYILVQPNRNDPREEGMLWCAIVGCLFSWIPLIGCLTFAVNADAPLGSPRRCYAKTACSIAMVVILFNIFFWSFGIR